MNRREPKKTSLENSRHDNSNAVLRVISRCIYVVLTEIIRIILQLIIKSSSLIAFHN